MHDLTLQIEQAIADLFAKVIQEPHIYFSEADLQQLLVEELKRQIPVLNDLYPTSIHRGKDSKGTFSTLMIHREYGAGAGRRLDAVVLHPSDIAKIGNPNLTIGKGSDYLHPWYAFELGTEKTGDAKDHISSDWKKLDRVRSDGVGYLIHVYHDVTQARAGTATRVNTEEKVDREFRRYVDSVSNDTTLPGPTKKALFILVRGYRAQSKMRGKCEIYVPREDRWTKVNVGQKNALVDKILEVLGPQDGPQINSKQRI